MSEKQIKHDRIFRTVEERDPVSSELSAPVLETGEENVTENKDDAHAVSPTQENIDPRAFARALLVSDKEIMDYLAR